MLKIENSYNLTKQRITLSSKKFYENYVDFNITLQSCKKCENYNKNWSCPPFQDDISQIWTKYNKIDLILLNLEYEDYITKDKLTEDEIETVLQLTLYNEKRKLLQSLIKETKEQEKNMIIISSNYCDLCTECSKIKGLQCRYPNNRLYSIESLGGLVTKMTKELFKTELLWVDIKKGKIPKHLNLVMAVLYENI